MEKLKNGGQHEICTIHMDRTAFDCLKELLKYIFSEVSMQYINMQAALMPLFCFLKKFISIFDFCLSKCCMLY